MASSLTRKEMSQMFRRIKTRKKEDKKVEATQLPQDAQGFICPICMEALRSAEALQVHWEAAHNDDKTGATSSITELDSSAVESSSYIAPLPQEGEDELEHYRLQVKIMSDIINEERLYCASLKVELAKLEGSLEKSGDQTREELRAMKQMFEQSEQSKSAMTAEIVRLTTEASYLQQENQNLIEANKTVTNKAGGLAMNVASLEARLDESLSKVEGFNSQILTLQSNLREQELRNERLSVKLQQRPEADDIRALQQQLSSLHIVMEQSANEHEKKMLSASHDMQQLEKEKNQLEKQLVAHKEQLSLLPKQEELTRLELQVSSLLKEVDSKQEIVAIIKAQFTEVQAKYDAAPKPETLQNLDSEIERLAHELGVTNEEKSKLEASVKILQIQLNEAPKKQQLDSLQSTMKSVQNSLQLAKESVQEKELEWAKLQEHSLHLETECDKQQGLIDTLRTEVKEIEQEKHKMELALAACKHENTEMKRQVIQLESKVTNGESEQKRLKEAIQESEATISQLHIEKAELIRKIKAGEGASAVISQVEQEEQKCEEYEEKLDISSDNNDKLVEYLESAREECRCLKEQSQKLEVSLKATHEKVEVLAADLSAKSSELWQKDAEYSQAQTEHTEKIATLTREWNKLKLQNDALEFDGKQLKETTSKHKQELENQLQFMEKEAQKRIDEFSSKLHSKDAQFEGKERELIELKVVMEQEAASFQQQLFSKNKELLHIQNIMQETLQSSKNSEDSMRNWLESFKSQFTAEKTEYVRQMEHKESLIMKLQEELDRARAEKDEMLTQRHEENAVLQDKQRKLEEEFSGRKASLELQVTDLKDLLSNSEGKVDTLQNNILRIVASTKKEQSMFEKQVAEKQVLLVECQKQLKAKQEDFDAWKENNAETMKDLNKQILKMQRELQLKSEALESQIKQHDSVRHQLQVSLQSESKLHEEVDSLRFRLENVDSNLKVETAKSVSQETEISSLNTELIEKRETVKSLNEMLELKTEMVEALQSDLVRGHAEFDQKRKDYDERYLQSEKELEYEKEKTFALELELEGARKDFEDLNLLLDQARETQATLRVKINQLDQELVRKREEVLSNQAEIVESEDQHETAIKELQSEIRKLKDECFAIQTSYEALNDTKEKAEHSHQIELTALTTSLATVRLQLDNSKIRAGNAEAEIKELSSELIEINKKSDLLAEEQRVLLEKFVVEEEQKRSLLQQNTHLQQQIAEIESGMQELGREYQTLQILHSRQLERKWERDSEANTCHSCNKKFTVGMRKHHCRQCGLIFCQSCSSKQAPLPSSRSPVRVCDTCYTELHLS